MNTAPSEAAQVAAACTKVLVAELVERTREATELREENRRAHAQFDATIAAQARSIRELTDERNEYREQRETLVVLRKREAEALKLRDEQLARAKAEVAELRDAVAAQTSCCQMAKNDLAALKKAVRRVHDCGFWAPRAHSVEVLRLAGATVADDGTVTWDEGKAQP